MLFRRFGSSVRVAAHRALFCMGTSSVTLPRRLQSSAPAPSEFSHITRDLVFGLWNEGNLFSLSAEELHYFLTVVRAEAGAGISPAAKKSVLVRHVEELLTAEQVSVAVPQEYADGAELQRLSGYDRVEEALDEADEYGDWGAEPGFEARRHVDYLQFSPERMGQHYGPLSPRAYQLLHSDLSADVGLLPIKASKFPGQSKVATAYTVAKVDVDAANEARFRRGLEWCLLNIWNTNMYGELNIGAGRILFYRSIAKQNKNALPMWTLQKHAYVHHPYIWFAIANASNVSRMEQLAEKLGMKLTQEATTSYKVFLRRQGETMDLELNAQLQCVKANRPWDRFLVSHYVRSQMPDLRYLVRARHPIKKRVADAYLDADILRSTRDSVQSILAAELGEVRYCCERVMRKWAMRTPCGVTLQLVETKRTPLIITRIGDEGERLEYEWIVALPQKAERVDTAALAKELWAYGNLLAKEMEEGLEEFMSQPMRAVSTY